MIFLISAPPAAEKKSEDYVYYEIPKLEVVPVFKDFHSLVGSVSTGITLTGEIVACL